MCFKQRVFFKLTALVYFTTDRQPSTVNEAVTDIWIVLADRIDSNLILLT